MRVRHYILTYFNVPRGLGGPKRPPGEAWTQRRIALFERYCAPSIRAQRNQDFIWLVRFDPSTPRAQLQHVRSLASNLEPIFEPFRQRIRRDVAGGAEYLIMTRLDNDDAVHADFTAHIRGRADGRRKIVDVKGYQLDVRDDRRHLYAGKYIETHRYPTPFISLLTPAAADFPMVTDHPHSEMGLRHALDASERKLFLQIIHGDNASNKIVGRRVVQPVDLSEFGL